MKRIEGLIILLLAMNPIQPKKGRGFFPDLFEKMRKQGIVIEKLRAAAQQEGTLLGRIITFDKSFYVISKIYPRTVQIDWLNYGDGWSDARAGHQALLDIEYAKAYVNFVDHSGGILPKPKIICPTITASAARLKEFTS
jgi:hypothetical protein